MQDDQVKVTGRRVQDAGLLEFDLLLNGREPATAVARYGRDWTFHFTCENFNYPIGHNQGTLIALTCELEPEELEAIVVALARPLARRLQAL